MAKTNNATNNKSTTPIRSMRTKVRCSDEELLKLHALADENRLKMTELLRGSTLNRNYDAVLSVAREDIVKLKNEVDSLDMEIGLFLLDLAISNTDLVNEGHEASKEFLASLALVRKATDIYNDFKASIDVNLNAITEKVSAKREKVSAELVSILEANTRASFYTYCDDYGQQGNAINIPVTVDELVAIRRLADEAGVTISCLLKTNAISLYGHGVLDVKCNSLDPVIKVVREKAQYISDLERRIKTTPFTKHDIKDFETVLKDVKKLFSSTRSEIKTSASEITRAAAEIVHNAA